MTHQNAEDGGSIIGYQPKLKYEKQLNQHEEAEQQKTAANQNSSSQITYSKTLRQFIDASPYIALKNLAISSEYIGKLIDKLSNAFVGGGKAEYDSIAAFLSSLTSEHNDFAMEFLNYHQNDIHGDIVPELINCIWCTQKRLDTVSSTLKDMYYGNKNITMEEAEEIDTANISQLRAYEHSGEISKINYYALAMDSEMNQVINSHTFVMNKLAMKVAQIIDGEDESYAQSSNVNLITSLFDEINTDITNRTATFSNLQDISLTIKALHNYYKQRKDALALYSLFADSKASRLFESKLDQRQKAVQDAISNIMRCLKAEEIYTTEFTKMETEKHFIKRIYHNLNYNVDG